MAKDGGEFSQSKKCEKCGRDMDLACHHCLNSKGKRDAIRDILTENKSLGDREVGRIVRAHHTTVGSVRERLYPGSRQRKVNPYGNNGQDEVRQCYRTPFDLFRLLDEVFNFTVDAADDE